MYTHSPLYMYIHTPKTTYFWLSVISDPAPVGRLLVQGERHVPPRAQGDRSSRNPRMFRGVEGNQLHVEAGDPVFSAGATSVFERGMHRR